MSATPKPGDRVKEISRAAAGSPEAEMFGYPKEGCYILSEGIQGETLTPLAGSVGKSPLILLGERLNGEWTPGSMI